MSINNLHFVNKIEVFLIGNIINGIFDNTRATTRTEAIKRRIEIVFSTSKILEASKKIYIFFNNKKVLKDHNFHKLF